MMSTNTRISYQNLTHAINNAHTVTNNPSRDLEFKDPNQMFVKELSLPKIKEIEKNLELGREPDRFVLDTHGNDRDEIIFVTTKDTPLHKTGTPFIISSYDLGLSEELFPEVDEKINFTSLGLEGVVVIGDLESTERPEEIPNPNIKTARKATSRIGSKLDNLFPKEVMTVKKKPDPVQTQVTHSNFMAVQSQIIGATFTQAMSALVSQLSFNFLN